MTQQCVQTTNSSARYLGDDFLSHMTFAYMHIPTSE